MADYWPKCGHEKTPETTYTWRPKPGRPTGPPQHRCRVCKLAAHVAARWTPSHAHVANAAAVQAARQRALERMEDIRWMQDTGSDFETVAKRLGIQQDSLRIWLRRWGYTWAWTREDAR